MALAAQQINLDALNSQIDTQDLEAARKQQQTALAEQVKKLHEAASDVRTGAAIQGFISGVGCLAEFKSAEVRPLDTNTYTTEMRSSKELEAIGKGLNAVGPAVGHYIGDGAQQDDTADATAAQARAANAQARAEEAEHHRDRMDQVSDRTLSSVNDIINAQNQGNLALIANI